MQKTPDYLFFLLKHLFPLQGWKHVAVEVFLSSVNCLVYGSNQDEGRSAPVNLHIRLSCLQKVCYWTHSGQTVFNLHKPITNRWTQDQEFIHIWAFAHAAITSRFSTSDAPSGICRSSRVLEWEVWWGWSNPSMDTEALVHDRLLRWLFGTTCWCKSLYIYVFKKKPWSH